MSDHLRNQVRSRKNSELILLATYAFQELLDREIFMAAKLADLQTAIDALSTAEVNLVAAITSGAFAEDLQPAVDKINGIAQALVAATPVAPAAPVTPPGA